jgi:hypothetical protein
MVLLSRVEETSTSTAGPTRWRATSIPARSTRRASTAQGVLPAPFPRWAYQGERWTLEKSVRLVRGENTVVVSYTLLGADLPAELEVRPLLALRSMHDLMYQWNGRLARRTGTSVTTASRRRCGRLRSSSRTTARSIPRRRAGT